MEVSSQKLNIYSYSSLRSFLKAHAEDQKAKKPTWSYGMWAKKLGLKGTASLTMIINGQRNAGPQMIDALVSYFGFTEKEEKFFRNLASLEKVGKDSSLEYLVLKELKRLSPSKEFKLFDDTLFETISNWYHIVIKQVLRLGITDAHEIAKRMQFAVSTTQVQKALQNLEKTQMIKKQLDGSYLINESYTTSNDIPSEAVKRYHEQTLDNAKLAVREIDVMLREFRSYTFLLKEEDLSKAKEKIRSFMDDFASCIDSNKGESVYQLNIQMFPMTKKNQKDSKESQ